MKPTLDCSQLHWLYLGKISSRTIIKDCGFTQWLDGCLLFDKFSISRTSSQFKVIYCDCEQQQMVPWLRRSLKVRHSILELQTPAPAQFDYCGLSKASQWFKTIHCHCVLP
jgi:hypothetical protein